LFHWLFWFNVDYCFTDCILLQCWLVSLSVFWFNVDYCFIDCILVQCWLLFRSLYFGSMLTIVSPTVFWFNVDYCLVDCILVQCWLLFNCQHWTKIILMKQLSTLNQNTVSETIVNIEPNYSQRNNSQHWTKIQSLVQCWLLFRSLYFGSMLTIVSLTVFWFNVDYCLVDCILVPQYSQWNNSQHWTKIQSVKQ
jgi:hypothetical protein